MLELEKEKYEKMWRCPEYRITSPGLNSAQDFLQHFQNRFHKGDSLIDFGCGTGKASFYFFFQGFSVYMVDIASNCLDEKYGELLPLCAEKMRFVEACLCDLPTSLEPADWIYCCDVLEHLPEQFIDMTLAQMAVRCKKGGFLQIFLQEEPFGRLISESLHLTLRSQEWWVQKIQHYWKIEAFGPEIPGFRFSVFLSKV